MPNWFLRSLLEASNEQLAASKTRLWFQIEREGDRCATLKSLNSTGQWFTVRSTYGSRFVRNGRRKERLGEVLARTPPRGTYRLFVRSRDDRKGRMATLRIRTTSVVLDMSERATRERYLLSVNILDVHEMGTTPDGEEPIHWRLTPHKRIW